ncbi:MAG: gamma carbonic anhydrase family protein [Bacteroidaceae bacterium]|nr:gamma carbonic anhydrase family protein [Bacteroidaceae bacterium]
MAIIKEVRGIAPSIGENCFMAETAAIIGDVKIGNDCSIWYSTVLRGDVNSISIGNKVNIQDGAVIHTLYQRSKTVIGNNVSIGHNATIHGATIEDNCLIGMGATVLDNAIVESGAIVAANALVTSGMVVESGYIYAGVPAKKIKQVSAEQQKEIVERIANDYVMYASWYKE